MSIPQAELKRIAIARWIIYLLVAIVIVFPLLINIPMSFEAEAKARDFYEQVEGLEKGTPVMVTFDFDPAAEAELKPMGMAVLRHCFEKGLVPTIMTHWPRGVGLARDVCNQVADEYGMESGKDYAFLGYKPGKYNLILAIGEDLKGTFDKDFYGEPTEGMPALEGVNRLKDYKLLIDLAAGITYEYWIQFGSDRHDIPHIAGTTAVMTPDLYPVINSGQLKGCLGGLRGVADYELLIDKPGSGKQGMAAQSAAHLLLIALLVFANVRYFVRRFVKKEKV